MCRVEQQRFQSEMDKLQHALEAKEAQMQRVVSGTGQVSALKQHYDRVLTDLAGERDMLQADRTRLLQVCCFLNTYRFYTPERFCVSHDALFGQGFFVFCVCPRHRLMCVSRQHKLLLSQHACMLAPSM